MSGHIIPLTPPSQTGLTHPTAPALPQHWGAPPAPPKQGTPALQRHLAALGRFKWLILLVTVLGTAGGVVATRFVDPQYVTHAELFIESGSPLSSGGGPAQAAELVGMDAWQTLFRSGRVTDAVVRELGLFVWPANAADSTLFRGFGLRDRFIPGAYELHVEGGGRYRLLLDGERVLDQGVVGDSIGRDPAGLQWRPNPALLTPGRVVGFTVVQPREATVALSQRLTAARQDPVLQLTLVGTDPVLTTRTLELWLQRFVSVAAELKQYRLRALANIQIDNLRRAEATLEQADNAFESFKIGAITQPTEATPVVGGVAETQSTALGSFFEQRARYDDLRRVRSTLERILAGIAANDGRIVESDLYALSTLTSGAGNAALTGSIESLYKAQAEQTALRMTWQDSSEVILAGQERIDQLQLREIPRQTQALLAQVRQQEDDLASRISTAETELQSIPARATLGQQLQRDVMVAEQIYSGLNSGAQQARLAAESALPDVSVLTYPVVPSSPTKNTVPQIILGAVLGSLGLGILLAFLVDRVDQRFRYPEQAKNELGLDILGAVPNLRAAKKGRQDPEEEMQVVEAFRLIRLNVRHALDTPGPILLTITSPAAGDGKSIVASNLAVSFAEAGHRTLLIDGDIRRGSLHGAFGVPQRPGLSEVLAGGASRKEALRQTTHRNLVLMAGGKRSRQAPELLASAAMTELLAQLQSTFDVIIVDSPPLSAGIDPYALSTATGNMVVVLRAGQTNMRLAHAKLSIVDRLPVFVVGTVLNGITPKGVYEYYSYDYGYAADDEEDETPATVGQLAPHGAELAQIGPRSDDEEPRGR